MNFHSPLNHQKTIDFLIILGEIELHLFAYIELILDAKLGSDTLLEEIIRLKSGYGKPQYFSNVSDP